jgi:hypothetical protein
MCTDRGDKTLRHENVADLHAIEKILYIRNYFLHRKLLLTDRGDKTLRHENVANLHAIVDRVCHLCVCVYVYVCMCMCVSV